MKFSDAAVSVVIPWVEWKPLNVPVVDVEDEVLIVNEALKVWEARLAGVLRSKNDWVVFTDSDAVYPMDYIRKVKGVIASGVFPYGFRTRRVGGFGAVANVEASLVLRKGFFLERAKEFRYSSPLREDFGYLFRDLPVVKEITYYHGFTHGEMTAISISGPLLLGTAFTALACVR